MTWVRIAFGVAAVPVSILSLVAAPVRVATFNIFNYLAMDRRVEGAFHAVYPKPEAEKSAIRMAIRMVNPDVLAIEEMGPAAYLDELRQDLAREGANYPCAVLLEAVDAERHVALLSRLTPLRVVRHDDVSFPLASGRERVKRGLLEVTFASPTGEWTIFVVHLKSRLTDRADDVESANRRTGEARALRDLIRKRFPDPSSARFVVLGDFNDTTNSKAVRAFLRRGETMISRIVPAVDSHGESWTYFNAREDVYSRADFILASGALWARIRRPASIFDGAGSVGGSDHRLVFGDLDLDAAQTLEMASPPGMNPGGDADDKDRVGD